MKIYCLKKGKQINDFYDLTVLNELKLQSSYKFEVSRYEYLVVQLLIHSDYAVQNVVVKCKDLISSSEHIEGAVHCFNTDVIDSQGRNASKTLNIKADVLQPLYIGINLSKAKIATYKTIVEIGDDKVELVVTTNDELVFNEGLNDPINLARLKWLNSKKAWSKDILGNYKRIIVEDRLVKILGRDIEINNSGLVKNCHSYFTSSNTLDKSRQKSLFYKDLEVVIGERKLNYDALEINTKPGYAEVVGKGHDKDLKVEIKSSIKYDGSIGYRIEFSSSIDKLVSNIHLKLYFKSCDYLMATGLEGQRIKSEIGPIIHRKWDENFNQETLFIGDVNCGARLKLVDLDVNKNMPGHYHLMDKNISSNWYNYGNGGIKIDRLSEGVEVDVFTGHIVVFKSKTLSLEFELDMTPLKELKGSDILGKRIAAIDIAKNYKNAIEISKNAKMDCITMKSGLPNYKYSDYPLASIDGLKQLSTETNKANIYFGIEYNLRSINTIDPIAHAINALGEEIFIRSDGCSIEYPQIEAMFGEDLAVDCYKNDYSKKSKYFNLLVRPQSRFNNYFLESVAMLVEKVNMQAITLSEPFIDRSTMERLKKILLNSVYKNPLIELEIYRQDNEASGNNSAMCNYAAVLPYIDKLWFNSDLDLSKNIDNIMLENTGVVFGIETTLSHQYPLSLALALGALPKFGVESLSSQAISEFNNYVDKHKMNNARFYGFWDEKNPLRVDNANVLSSSYEFNGQLILSIFNYSNVSQLCELGIETKFGISLENKHVFAPFLGIEQNESKFDMTKPIKLKPYSGIVAFAVDRNSIVNSTIKAIKKVVSK